MQLNFNKIAIVNRGESATRLQNAVTELRHESGQDLKTVALFTEPDRESQYVYEADESYCLGEATTEQRSGQRKSSYLDYDNLRHALRTTNVDAAWVGWGFVAEHAEFAELCDELGIVFIGPSADVMRKLGNKIEAKLLAETANMPVSPWSNGPVSSQEQAQQVLTQLGYPVVIKAAAGGGGRGIRKVTSEDQLAEAFERARAEALVAFGDDTVFIERMVNAARHVEVQIIADSHGTCWTLGTRDCTIQRRHQKVIEEGPCVLLSPDTETQLLEAARRLVLQAGYKNAGTIECLYDEAQNEFYFMEVNTRLQVEHPVTEQITGVDLVKLQLHVANGDRLAESPPEPRGHAIEARINAEDPDRNFAPAPGRLKRFSFPSGPGVRVDSGFSEGDVVPADFDSMIAKIICHGSTRSEALCRLKRALDATTIVVEGGASNRGFLAQLVEHEELVDNRTDVTWLDRLTATLDASKRPYAHVALAYAAICVFDREHREERRQFLSSAARGRPRIRDSVGCEVELMFNGQRYEFQVYRSQASQYRLSIQGTAFTASVRQHSNGRCWLTINESRHHIILSEERSSFTIEVNGVPHRISGDEGGVIRAPTPAIVIALNVKEGDIVAPGQRMAVLEVMKTELALVAPAAARVKRVLASANRQVDAGTPIFVTETIGSDSEASQSKRVEFHDAWTSKATGEADVHRDSDFVSRQKDYRSLLSQRYLTNLREIKPFLLGFDITPAQARGCVRELLLLQENVTKDDAKVLIEEAGLITLFADVVSFYESSSGKGEENSYDHLLAYFQTLGAESENLPDSFIKTLRRVVGHYGLDNLDQSEQLEDALFLFYRAHKRAKSMTHVIEAIVQRWLNSTSLSSVREAAKVEQALERLIDVSFEKFVGLHDQARQTIYRHFHQPFFARTRQKIYAQLETKLQMFEEVESSAELFQLKKLLVRSTQPVAGLLSRWLHSDHRHKQQIALECLVDRFYQERKFISANATTIDGLPFIFGQFPFQQATMRVVACSCTTQSFKAALKLIERYILRQENRDDTLVDVFLVDHMGESNAADESSHDLCAESIAKELRSVESISNNVSRICVCVLDPRGKRALGYFTFARKDGSYQEVSSYRGLHPMWAGRLELWRLRNFDTERLPAAQDTYLFRAQARDNPLDRRLFAFVDVRETTPVIGKDGKTVRLPQFEQSFTEAMASLRDVLYRLPPKQRPQWNRVLFFLWQPLTLDRQEFSSILTRLAPAADHLGLEKVVIRVRIPDQSSGKVNDKALHFSLEEGQVVRLRASDPARYPVRALTPYSQKVMRARSRGLTYPYEIIRMITPSQHGASVLFPPGDFIEHDLVDEKLVPIKRPYGENKANVIVGIIENKTAKFPEGMKRVILLGDPTHGMGSVSEPECRRIIAALDLAEELQIPVEWYAVSAGAKIAMDSGTENLDWCADVVRHIVQFTQAGGEINVIVCGINVGAQSYWNAEATMLNHTRGILVMTLRGSMVLTGKKALDYSGSVFSGHKPRHWRR